MADSSLLSAGGQVHVFIGIDVSKAKLDCTLLTAEADKRKTKAVVNTAAGVQALLAWCAKHGAQPAQLHAILEPTGLYHEQAATALPQVRVSLVNPAQARDFAKALALRSKNDALDSYVLARYGQTLSPALWHPAPLHARQLRALLTRREALSKDLLRELNRKEKSQFSPSAPLVDGSIDKAIAFLREQIKQIERAIDQHIDNHPDLKQDCELLNSIPAIGPQAGNAILAVMHNRHIDSAQSLAAYLGVVPVQRQSGSSLNSCAHLSKAGPSQVRATLYMAALVGTRHNPHIRALYQRLLKAGKSKKAALGAAMRKLVHLCFGVLKNRIPYQPNYAMNG
ncbi:IS110-like element IS1663 family transposase [Bordetella pertussis]|uniref:IS110-like element IS1663 family transposase n=1 Tax=Bordetella pertussis TaxID=520 RepID=UPI00053011CD|nr:IS110-like element IS1663 family transposase [Bordetella pertussis]AIW94843.1 transposase for IS1663 [Bordetella pertussis B1920]